MALLAIEGVTKRFGGLTAVNDVSLAVEKGEIVGLIGPNGSGKTTLFNLLCGFYRPDEGKITLNERSLNGLPPNKVCHLGIGRTFQIVMPFKNMTVQQNVAAGAFFSRRVDGGKARQKVDEILKFTGLYPRKDTPAASLTLAERKRLEMARALATSPELLLLDEVMAGLNPVEIDEAVGLARKVREQGVTVFMIEHVMRAIMKVSDRVIVLNEGRKIAEGVPSQVASDKQVVKVYLGEELA